MGALYGTVGGGCACGTSTCMDMDRSALRGQQCRATTESSDGDFDHLMAGRSRRGRGLYCPDRVRLYHRTGAGLEEVGESQHGSASRAVQHLKQRRRRCGNANNRGHGIGSAGRKPEGRRHGCQHPAMSKRGARTTASCGHGRRAIGASTSTSTRLHGGPPIIACMGICHSPIQVAHVQTGGDACGAGTGRMPASKKRWTQLRTRASNSKQRPEFLGCRLHRFMTIYMVRH